MTRDPAVAELLGQLQATFRRMSSHERRLERLAGTLSGPGRSQGPPLPLPATGRLRLQDRQLRCVSPITSSRD